MNKEELKEEQPVVEEPVKQTAVKVEKPDGTEVAAVAEKPAVGWHQYVKDAFPDREFASDDDLHAGAEELIKNLQEETKSGKEAMDKARAINQRLVEVFEQYPEIANFMDDVMKGASPEIAIARNFDTDNIQPQDGDPDYDEWEKALQERKKKTADLSKFQEELDANKVESSKIFDKFAEEKGYDEAKMDEFLGEVDKFLSDIYRGRVTMDFLKAIEKAMNYGKDVADAAEQAKIDARNEKIELKKEKLKPKGDGIPNLTPTGETADAPKKEEDYADKLLKSYRKRQIKV